MTLSFEEHVTELPQSPRDGPAPDGPAPQAELVHWMGPDRMQLAPAGLAATTLAAVALGIAAVAAFRYLAPRHEGLPPWRARRVLH